jgi:hypothetical protein
MLEDAQDLIAVGSQVERGVGRLVDEGTDAEGPRGTYGCACLDRDSVQCAAIRYGMDRHLTAGQCRDPKRAGLAVDRFGRCDIGPALASLLQHCPAHEAKT